MNWLFFCLVVMKGHFQLLAKKIRDRAFNCCTSWKLTSVFSKCGSSQSAVWELTSGKRAVCWANVKWSDFLGIIIGIYEKLECNFLLQVNQNQTSSTICDSFFLIYCIWQFRWESKFQKTDLPVTWSSRKRWFSWKYSRTPRNNFWLMQVHYRQKIMVCEKLFIKESFFNTKTENLLLKEVCQSNSKYNACTSWASLIFTFHMYLSFSTS